VCSSDLHMAYHIDRNTAVTVAGAAASFTIKPGKHTVTFWGFDNAGNKSALQTVTVIVKDTPRLGKPTISQAKPKRNKTFTIAGKIGSANMAKNGVSLTIQRKIAGKWKTVATKRVTLKAGAKKFSLKVKVTKAGLHRVRATHKNDAMHVSGVSSFKTFTVK